MANVNYTLSRERNLLHFLMEGQTNPYTLDVNTGVFFGMSGKPVKSCPKGFGDWIYENRRENNVLFLLSNIRDYPHLYIAGNYNCAKPKMNELEQFASLFSTADRLESIGYHMKNGDDVKTQVLDFVQKHFKGFVRYLRENPNGSMAAYKLANEKAIWAKEVGITEGGHFTQYMIDMLWRRRDQFTTEQIPLVVYYISRGLYDFFSIEEQSDRWGNNGYECRMFEKLFEYFDLCEKLNVQPEKEDFFRSFINLRRTYVTHKKVLDMEALKQNYAKRPALAYENDEFIVVIPQTRDDFLAEANAQQNCVYSYYLQKVIENRTYVVFVRRKSDPKKSFVTCEVSKNGNIQQYLGYGNAYVTDDAAKNFKKDYQAHLKNLWK